MPPSDSTGGSSGCSAIRTPNSSQTGIIRSNESGREYRFKYPFVDIRGPIPRVGGLREGMQVGFDVGWTSSGLIVTVVRVEE